MSSVDCVNHDVPIAPHTIPPIPTKSRIVIRLTTDREQQSAIMIFGFKMNFFRYFSMKSLFKCLVCYINFVKFFCGFLKSKYFPVLLVLYIYIYIYIFLSIDKSENDFIYNFNVSSCSQVFIKSWNNK